MSVLTIEALGVRFDGVVALDGVSFAVEPGRSVGVNQRATRQDAA
jgi:ABC-type branched-subunit amino acid transport system ATPase component